MITTIVLIVVATLLLATALTEDTGRELRALGPVQNPLLNDAVLYDGAIVCRDGNGELQPGDDATGFAFEGIYRGAELDNADDGEEAIVDGLSPYRVTSSGLAQSNLGDPVFITDDNTVALSGTTYAIWGGNIIEVISATECWVMPPRAVYITLANVTFTAGEVADAADAVSTADVISALSPPSAVTPTNTDGAIGDLTISDPPTQAEVQALRAACETLADDYRATNTAVSAIITLLTALIAEAELASDDGRAALTTTAATLAALKTLTLLTDPS